MRKNSGNYGEKLPYTLAKNVSPSDEEVEANIQRTLTNKPVVTENQNVYESKVMDEE